VHQLINPTLARTVQTDRLRHGRFAAARYRRPAQHKPPDALRAKAARATARAAARLDADAARRAIA
jgi:hypothetical protein